MRRTFSEDVQVARDHLRQTERRVVVPVSCATYTGVSLKPCSAAIVALSR
jgi:hypothetical protein